MLGTHFSLEYATLGSHVQLSLTSALKRCGVELKSRTPPSVLRVVTVENLGALTGLALLALHFCARIFPEIHREVLGV